MGVFTEKPKGPRLKVNLKTSAFRSSNKVVIKKEIYAHKKPNPEHLLDCFFSELCLSDGTDFIVNIGDCADGYYEVIWCNISTDYESGIADDWDIKLVPWVD